MAALDFPTSPTLGQIYSANGFSWKWDGTSWVSASAFGQLLDSQTFTSSTTYTMPSGAQFVLVECIGAGGGGVGNSGNGGAGGGYWMEYTPAVTVGSSATVTIGSGGAGSSTPPGGRGGDSRFGPLYFPGAPGGYDGGVAYGGMGFVSTYGTATIAADTYDAAPVALGSGGTQYYGNGAYSTDAGLDNYRGGGGGGYAGNAGGKSYTNAVPLTQVDSYLVPTSGNGAAAGANGTGSDGGGGGTAGNNGGNGGTPGGGGGGGGSGATTGGNGGNAQIKIWVFG